MSQSSIDDIKDIFANVNSWLTYADIKIGVLLTFDVTVLFGIIQEYHEISNLVRIGVILLLLSIIFLIVSATPIIYSIPGLYKIISFRFRKKNRAGENYIFFMDIASKTEDEFISSIKQRYHLNFDNDNLADDYLHEIYVNSKIATIKNLILRLAVIPTFISIILVIIFFFNA